MPTIEFVGQSVRHEAAPGANSSRLLNCYREAVPVGGVTRHIIKPVLGQVALGNLGSVLQRDLAWVDGSIYSVAGGSLYRISDAGVATTLGTVKNSPDTSISGNTGNVTVCAGGKYYVYDGASVSEPSTGAFTNFGSVETLANFTLLTERNGRRIQWSAVGDPTSLDPLDFATSESRTDNNLRGVALSGFFWVFKERSIEVWYPTGLASSSAFRRISGAGGVIDTGLKAFNLVTKARDSLFFVGSDGIVYLTTGQGILPVSARSVEESIRQHTATHALYYEADGHKFCVIRFSDRPAWVYDIATGEWHERSEGRLHGAWEAVASARTTTGFWMVGSELGDIVKLDRVRTDRGDELYRRMITRTLRLESNRFRVPEFEIYGAYGYNEATARVDFLLPNNGGYIGFEGGQYYDMGSSGMDEPIMQVSTSRDSGATFGTPRRLEMGAQGEYETRGILRALGQFRTFTARIDITHAYEMPIYADARIKAA